MKATVVPVRTSSKPYNVHVGTGILKQLDDLISKAGATGRRFVVSSHKVWEAHGPTISKAIGRADNILVPDGERAKTVNTVGTIYDALIQAQADRTATIIAVGGGVIGDVVGFAAATYLRGVRLVHVPTTLLAQVDSSIGGKVGVNHRLGKNLIGAFYQPSIVVSDPVVLGTLPRREFRSGLYEVVKYGMIRDPELFQRLHSNLSDILSLDPIELAHIISTSCRIKASVVSEDEYEGNVRRILNFGHTAGHAIEAATRYRRFRHGEAIAYGMLLVADLAARRGLLKQANQEALAKLITELGPLPSIKDLSAKSLVEIMGRDKKVLKGRLHVVLPTRIGKTVIVNDITPKELKQSLRVVGTAP